MAVGDKYYLGGQKAFPNYFSYNSIVSTTEVNVPLGFMTNCIKFISNDDDTNDLIVSFGTTSTTATAGLNGVIILKPGEVINELNISVSKINFKRVAGSGNVRFVGV